jgi:hypothetical protein
MSAIAIATGHPAGSFLDRYTLEVRHKVALADAWNQLESYMSPIKRRAGALRERIRERAYAEMRAAGCSHPAHLHNAFVGPRWAGVDYNRLRRARHLMAESFKPESLASLSWKRAFNRILAEPFGYCPYDL